MNKITLRKRKAGKQSRARRRAEAFLEEIELVVGFLQRLPEGHQRLYFFVGIVELIDHRDLPHLAICYKAPLKERRDHRRDASRVLIDSPCDLPEVHPLTGIFEEHVQH